jgi:hypothetical protein
VIYFSQVSRAAPAAFFSAPRARGITWLAEPLALFTSSVPALRVYLTVLSGLALYLAFRIWFKVLPAGAVIIAAVLFGSLWISRLYGSMLMPNLWVAFGTLAAFGGFLRLTVNRSDPVGLIALPLGLAFAAVMRPTDAAWASAALLVMTLLVPAWRRVARISLLIVVGAAIGAAPWVIEAYLRYGGLAARLNRASEIEGGLGWYPSGLFQHWQTLDGPLLCRPCELPPSRPPLDTFWLLLLPIAAIFAAVVSRRRAGKGDEQRAGRRDERGVSGSAMVVVPAVAGLALAVPYLLLVSYSAPRFLTAAIASFTIPFGVAVRWLALAALRSGVFRYPLIGVLGLALAAYVVSQQTIVTRQVAGGVASGQGYAGAAAELHQLGVRPPCVISGHRAPPIAYYAGCSSRLVGGPDGSITDQELVDLARREPVAWISTSHQRRPSYTWHWLRTPMRHTVDAAVWIASVSPPKLRSTH